MRRVTLWLTLLALMWLGYRLVVLQPTNQRDWEYGMDVLAHVTIEGDVVRVQNLRDFHWPADGPPSSGYVDRAFDVQRLERVWFVKEPFTIPWLRGFEGVAHTYFVFDFQDQPPAAVSVETRRERGEGYDAVHGLINEYELIYIWGTEQDLTGRRAVVESDELYMYPLLGSMESARRLFLNLAEESRQIEQQPRFYNTFTSNCTNELAKAANHAQPGGDSMGRGAPFPRLLGSSPVRQGLHPQRRPARNRTPAICHYRRRGATDRPAGLLALLRLRLNVQESNSRAQLPMQGPDGGLPHELAILATVRERRSAYPEGAHEKSRSRKPPST
jgi:hypothetical protein